MSVSRATEVTSHVDSQIYCDKQIDRNDYCFLLDTSDLFIDHRMRGAGARWEERDGGSEREPVREKKRREVKKEKKKGGWK